MRDTVVDKGWNVMKLAERLGIQDRIFISSSGTDIPSISNADLNLVYNACDVGVNTAMCEGWGLVSFEHAATGKAQIVPAVPSLHCLWENAALQTPIESSVDFESLLAGYVVDEQTLAEQLEQLYEDTRLRRAVAKACQAVATRPEYCWDSIATCWAEKLRLICNVSRIGEKSKDDL